MLTEQYSPLAVLRTRINLPGASTPRIEVVSEFNFGALRTFDRRKLWVFKYGYLWFIILLVQNGCQGYQRMFSTSVLKGLNVTFL